MRSTFRLTLFFWLLALSVRSQPPVAGMATGRFLTDSVEIGRPFQYAVAYRHRPTAEVLFPDTARHFAPFWVQQINVFPTVTDGIAPNMVSRDSAVYTLVSFETSQAQTLQVPIRLVNDTDCTTVMTSPDTIFLRSRLPVTSDSVSTPTALTLAANTKLITLQQEFNYPVLVAFVVALSLLMGLLYLLFGRSIRRQWRLYRLRRQHVRFLREYNRLIRGINADTATDTANQAVMAWKTYLETLERQPYLSLTTPEIAERVADARVVDALREADRMIYGGEFSGQSQSALRLLREVATQAYHRRARLLASLMQPEPQDTAQSPFAS